MRIILIYISLAFPWFLPCYALRCIFSYYLSKIGLVLGLAFGFSTLYCTIQMTLFSQSSYILVYLYIVSVMHACLGFLFLNWTVMCFACWETPRERFLKMHMNLFVIYSIHTVTVIQWWNYICKGSFNPSVHYNLTASTKTNLTRIHLLDMSCTNHVAQRSGCCHSSSPPYHKYKYKTQSLPFACPDPPPICFPSKRMGKRMRKGKDWKVNL